MKEYYNCVNCQKKTYKKLICDDCKTLINDKPIFHYPIEDLEFIEVGATYSGIFKEILLDFKFNDKISHSRVLGDYMIEKLLKHNLANYVITSVPMTKNRKNKRGFNQSEILARYIAKELDLKYEEVFEKIIETPFQVGLDKKERKVNLNNAFDILTYQDNIIIVDDVITTGATINELVNTAKKNNIKKVAAIIAATEIA